MVRKKTTREIYKANRVRVAPASLRSLVVWLHNIRSMHNVGSVFRSADAFGVEQVVLTGYTPVPPRPEISKTALGAEEKVKWRHYQDPFAMIRWCRENNLLLAGLEQTHSSRELNAFQPDTGRRICLLFGNEVTGIENELLTCCDHLLEIPQYGHKHSLNISVSVGIALYHFLLSACPDS